MFCQNLLALWVLLLTCTAAAQFKAIKINSADLPKALAYKGKVADAMSWSDVLGKHVIVLTETGEFKSKVQQSDVECYGECTDAELYAYHFVQQKDSAKLQWQLTDYERTCPFDINVAFAKGSLAVTDLDKDNTAEVWFVYKTTCTSDVSPQTMKLFMYEDNKRYAIRGTSKVKTGPKETRGGEMRMDNAFKTAPKIFRDFAVKHWNKFVLDTYE